jgi:tetraacyldisaccharide 4'-kinase
LVYRSVFALRAEAYRCHFLKSQRFAVPVIVVGNVVVGGGGKTPLVIELVRHLTAQGRQVGVVSRGYGRLSTQTVEVRAEMLAAQTGDEPALIKRATNVPVFVSRRRSDAVRLLLDTYPQIEVVLADDGLQHLALERDIEIVAVDDRGVGNGWMLPAGPLREPWPRRSGSVRQLILHTGQVPAFAGFTSTRRLADQAVAADGRRVQLADLRGNPVVALAAIASPESFFTMLRARGLTLAACIALPDHHNFESIDLQNHMASTLLCTEKDAVKIFANSALTHLNMLAVPLVFEPEPAFFVAFDELLSRFLSPLPSNHGNQTS